MCREYLSKANIRDQQKVNICWNNFNTYLLLSWHRDTSTNGTVNIWVVQFPLEKIKYFIISYLCSGVEAVWCWVYSTSHAPTIWQKMGGLLTLNFWIVIVLNFWFAWNLKNMFLLNMMKSANHWDNNDFACILALSELISNNFMNLNIISFVKYLNLFLDVESSTSSTWNYKH